jgi:hypothetical protein
VKVCSACGWPPAGISVAQVVQLEEGGDSHFYTPAIKRLAGRQAMKALRTWAASQTARTASLPNPVSGAFSPSALIPASTDDES